jgi:hypothetical protein
MCSQTVPAPLLLRLSGETDDALRTGAGDCAIAGIGVMCLCGAAVGIIACYVSSSVNNGVVHHVESGISVVRSACTTCLRHR